MEANPSPDMAAIMQQLKAIAKDNQDMKNVNGTTNDKVSAIELILESLGTLPANMSACQVKIVELKANVRTSKKNKKNSMTLKIEVDDKTW